MNYMARQFLAEMGLSQWRSREFWGMMLMLLIVFWLRMYLHYIGQWLFLSAIRIPINKSVNCSASRHSWSPVSGLETLSLVCSPTPPLPPPPLPPSL